jgi:uncharacterized membrane protein YjgN (DUF898 family)
MDTTDGFAPTQALPEEEAASQPLTQALGIRFTGSGSEYFRIWIVNLLLTLITLTFYWPFARARRMAYFQNNTLVGGDPLGFHARPWTMFRGYLVMILLGGGYWAVSHFLPGVAWLAFLALALVWPALWRASLQFRLRNTSWRGVRLAFLGETREAYLCMLPLFVPGVVMLFFVNGMEPGVEPDPQTSAWLGISVGITLLLFAAVLPWLMFRIKRYQHGGYAFAQERTELRLGARRFYGLYFKIFLVSLGALLGGMATLALIGWVLKSLGLLGGLLGSSKALAFLVPMVFMVLIYLFLPLMVAPYATTQLQNLIWSHTASTRIQMNSALRFRDMFRVTLVNWLLIILTLGLYWPFAKVRVTRLRLEAVSLQVEGSVDDWVAQAQPRGKGVLGDAAGDFFGIDMGL